MLLVLGAIVLLAIAIWVYVWSWDIPNAPTSLFVSSETASYDRDYRSIPTEKKVLVIGAGFCGLGLAASLRRHDIPFDVMECDTQIGGNWNSGVYETVHIISSKKTTEYKDFPMPKEYPDFPSAKEMLAYFHSYCDHFKIRENILFSTKVLNCKPIDGGKQWEVTYAPTQDVDSPKAHQKAIYETVIIANGHHWDCRYPNYKGIDQFGGEIIHSKHYKNPQVLVGKRVLVIGGGNSACDIAVESARFATSAHITMRRGYWFMPRTISGLPSVEYMRGWMPMWLQRFVIGALLRIVVGRYENYGLETPDHKLFEHHPTINSELLHNLKLGDIKAHPDIAYFGDVVDASKGPSEIGNKRLTKADVDAFNALNKDKKSKKVTFVDGTSHEFDLVVCCTGYHLSIPMLERDVLPYKDNIPQVVGDCFLPHHSNCVVYGIAQARYGAGPLITLGADSCAKGIIVQRQLKHGIGQIMSALGVKPTQKNSKSADLLMDPHAIWFKLIWGRRLLPLLPFVERFMIAVGLLK